MMLIKFIKVHDGTKIAVDACSIIMAEEYITVSEDEYSIITFEIGDEIQREAVRQTIEEVIELIGC